MLVSTDFRDKGLEEKITIWFDEIGDIRKDQKKIFDFFQNLVKEKVLGVRIGSGNVWWCKDLIGCTVEEFEKREANEEIKDKILNTLDKTYKLIKDLQNLKKQEPLEPEKIRDLRDLFEKSIVKNHSSVKMVIIKLFSLLFPSYFLPVLNEEHYKDFLKIFNVEENDYDYNRGEQLIKKCEEYLAPFMKPNEYIYFLYLQGKFLINDNYKLKEILEGYNFFSYPLEEQSIVGLFYSIINSDHLPNRLKYFQDFKTLNLQTSFPDLVGKIGDEEVTIEFEYDLKSYEGHLKEPLLADFIICWENEKNPKSKEKIEAVYKERKKSVKIFFIKDEILKECE